MGEELDAALLQQSFQAAQQQAPEQAQQQQLLQSTHPGRFLPGLQSMDSQGSGASRLGTEAGPSSSLPPVQALTKHSWPLGPRAEASLPEPRTTSLGPVSRPLSHPDWVRACLALLHAVGTRCSLPGCPWGRQWPSAWRSGHAEQEPVERAAGLAALGPQVCRPKLLLKPCWCCMQEQLRLPSRVMDPQLMLLAGLDPSHTPAGAVSVNPLDPRSQLRHLLAAQQSGGWSASALLLAAWLLSLGSRCIPHPAGRCAATMRC